MLFLCGGLGAINKAFGRGSWEKCRLPTGPQAQTCENLLFILWAYQYPPSIHQTWSCLAYKVIGDKLDKMDPSTFEPRACELLHGLGFSKEMMQKARDCHQHSGTVAQASCRTFTRYDIQNIAAKHAHRSCGHFMQGCKLPKSEPGHIRQPWPGYQRHVWWLAHACCPGTSFVCGTYAPSPWRAMDLLCRTFWGPIFFLYAIHCR